MTVARRTGDIVFRGPIPSVSILSSGTGTVYVLGVTKSVDVNLSGIGNAVIDAASGAFAALPLFCSLLALLPVLKCRPQTPCMQNALGKGLAALACLLAEMY